MIIQHGTIYTPDGFRRDQSIRIEDGRITAIAPDGLAAPGELAPSGDERVLDAAGRYVVPGFVDLHVHGAAGYDTMDGTPEALQAMARYFVRHGVTSFLATTITASHEATVRAVRNVTGYVAEQGGAPIGAPMGAPPGARVVGVHLEGPYINSAAKGAQPESYCRAPDLAELDQLIAMGPVRLITLAPELPGAESFVRAAAGKGLTVAIGHTRAGYEQTAAALDWGASHGTHTFNAMTGLHHREPGAVGALLTDPRATTELIADFIHLHPAVIALAVRVKTPQKVALVTDAMRATGLPDGTYDLGGQSVVVSAGACWLAGPSGQQTTTLAGSTLNLETALRNTMQACGLSLAETLPMLTAVPAREIGMEGQIGVLAPQALGDVVLLDEACRVTATIVGGEIAYERGTDEDVVS